MKKRPTLWMGMLAFFALMLVWGGHPRSGWALTQSNALCRQCHTAASIMDRHHLLPGFPSCLDCHSVTSIGQFLPPPCIDCHDFRGGINVPVHDFHTALIPGQIPACETCHTDGVPGGPLREPFGECDTCHTGFQGGPNGTLHQQHTNVFGATDCNTCHGTGTDVCSECHQVVSTDHGVMAHDFRLGPGAPGHDFHTDTQGIANCETCHVSGAPVGGPLREPFGECAACHTGFQGGPRSGTLHQDHTSVFGAADCTICHSDNTDVCSECHQVVSTDHGVMAHDFRLGPGAPGHDFHTDTQGITNCETCHVSGTPDVTPIHEVGIFNECTGCHYTNLLYQHDFACGLCHGSDSQTVQEAIANHNIDCRACHGEMPHAMDCMLCHNDQNPNNFLGTRSRKIHEKHMDKTACGVCHEFRNVSPQSSCGLCHSPRSISSAQSVHRKHMKRFDTVARPCFWCHGTDIPEAPANVCNLCHTGRSGDRITAHRRHGEDFICTICHDNVSGFGFDVRTGTPRSEVCTVCHGVKDEGFRKVHEKHLGKAQCFSCHGRSNVYAKVRGNLDCSICHGFENETFRKVHRKHVGDGAMCAVCHRVEPPSVQGVEGENAIPGYGTLPETEPGPPTPGPGAGLGSSGAKGRDGGEDKKK